MLGLGQDPARAPSMSKPNASFKALSPLQEKHGAVAAIYHSTALIYIPHPRILGNSWELLDSVGACSRPCGFPAKAHLRQLGKGSGQAKESLEISALPPALTPRGLGKTAAASRFSLQLESGELGRVSPSSTCPCIPEKSRSCFCQL